MQKLFAFVFFATLASVGGPAFAGDANNATANPDRDLAEARELDRQLQQALPRTARWLLEHKDPRKRAAGLLYSVSQNGMLEAQAAMVERTTTDEHLRQYDSIRQSALDALDRAKTRNDELPALKPAELLDRFEKAVRTTTDGAALAWLATACATADIEMFCIDAGLDDAIVRHDGANLFSRGALLNDPTSDQIEALILDANETKTYWAAFLTTWFDALGAVDAGALLDNHERLLNAYTMAMAYAIPAYQYLDQACGAAVTPGSELELACDRVLDDMAEHGDTALTQLMPSSVRARRASARGLDRRAAEFEAEKQRLHARASCAASEIEALLEASSGSTIRRYLALLVEHGESEGMVRFVEARGIDCSTPADLAAPN
ncbi:MAG: hypothetical protein KGY53_09610 [Wenzhouxiangellaceae bacterium]|nr:hypothetical protein [Wenzhouxiangellaceae bacterium]